MNTYGFRMRLARRIAPAPIMVDPQPELTEGAFVVLRTGRASMTLVAEKFRVKMWHKVPVFDRSPDSDNFYNFFDLRGRGRSGTFVGTLVQ